MREFLVQTFFQVGCEKQLEKIRQIGVDGLVVDVQALEDRLIHCATFPLVAAEVEAVRVVQQADCVVQGVVELVTGQLPVGEFSLGVGQRGADAVLLGAELVQRHRTCVVGAQYGVTLVSEALDLPFRGPDALVAVRE